MPAKRVRDLDRRTNLHRRLTTVVDGATIGTTTFPLLQTNKAGVQEPHSGIRIERKYQTTRIATCR